MHKNMANVWRMQIVLHAIQIKTLCDMWFAYENEVKHVNFSVFAFSFVSSFGRISCYRWHFRTCSWQVEGIFSAISWVNIYFIRLFRGIGPFYNITIGVNVFSSFRVDENIIFTLHFAFDTEKPIDRSQKKNIWGSAINVAAIYECVVLMNFYMNTTHIFFCNWAADLRSFDLRVCTYGRPSEIDPYIITYWGKR